ncbi:MerR family transcriptional regulator [Cryobacterium sp. BB307]|uniref:MerR family transcriptional regulator n=1 Tax=Cryobacterium sp. BB307 TaxID=2716317 RepID=UPI0014460229
MRISEAADRARVSQTTLKYYIREGLVHEGARIATNQTVYDESHVKRAKLVRALLETGGLSVAEAGRVLAAVDEHPDAPAYAFEAAQHAMGAAHRDAGSSSSRERVTELAKSSGWGYSDQNPGIAMAARVLDGFDSIDFALPDDFLASYAAAAERLAKADILALQSRHDTESVTELMVAGTVLGDALIAGLRRIAQENESAAAFPVDQSPAQPTTGETQ